MSRDLPPNSDHAESVIPPKGRYGARYDNAVACLTQDREALLAFFDRALGPSPRHIGGQVRGEAAGLAHISSPAAKRRPERYSSRCSGSRRKPASGITSGMMAPQFPDNLARLVKPTHMRVAGGKPAISPWVARILLDRKEQLGHCLIEAPA